ncbi:hypothetical protein IJ380_02255 [Candidatus Saccharibacteria bacterium]|nr:hypothetical protein [Candidatus Saccharibacteria bacterium]
MLDKLKIFGDGATANLVNALNRLPRNSAETTRTNVINYILYAAGLLAVVMIVVSGLKMTTSAGDAGAVSKAKSTLIYSIIGLILVILAYAIVNFVIAKVS